MQGLFHVETALSVKEAQEKLKHKAYDVIVSDYQMPERNGLDFLKELRDGGNDVPFILFTEKGREEVVIKALNLGADRYCNKIGNPEAVYGELVHSLRKAVKAKWAEKTLRESEKKYRSLFENAHDVIVLMDLEGNVTSVNKAAVKYGLKKDEIIEKNITQFVSKKDWPQLLKDRVHITQGKSVESKIEVKTPQGKKLAEYRSNPIIVDNQVVGIQTILRDITERKKVEEALRESEEKYRELINGMNDTAWVIDFDCGFIDVNDAAVRVLGYSREELLSMNIFGIDFTLDPEKIRALVKGMPKDEIQVFETAHTTKDGKTIPVEINSSLVTYKGKQSILSIARDITKRKKAEEELKRMMKELTMAIEKLGVVGKLTRHDARNKLSVITNNLYLAKQRLADDPKTLEYLGEIESAIDQVEKIFDFARTYEMLGVEGLSYVNAEKSVEEAAMLFSELNGAKLKNECHGLTVLADSLLRQLFYNLIDNTLKHGEEVSQIRIYYKEGKNQLKLVYEDDGIGIPEDEKEKIFKEGYGKGTGYGLYLIQKICEVYGWAIQERGKPSKGAQFTMTIPKLTENGKLTYQINKE